MNVKRIIYILQLAVGLFFFSNILSNEVLNVQTELTEIIINKNQSSLFLPVTLSSVDKSYFYSNPKGPGTGKAIAITVKVDNTVIDTTIYIEKPEKYLSTLEESPDKWVLRHTGTTNFFINLNSFLTKDKSKVTLLIEALLCDDKNCTPLSTEYSFSVSKGSHSSEFLLTSLPTGLHSFPSQSDTTDSSEAVMESQNEFLFQPRFIQKSSVAGFLPALILGLLAGIILNVMPCVLPVISLKLMALINHSSNRRKLFINSLFYTSGVLLSFVLLATLAVFAGQGWGALFQQQEFIIVMSIIIFGLSLSMLGLYTLTAPPFLSGAFSNQNNNGYLSSLLSGLLATILATPCSGPFLGATLTWTLTQKPLIVYTVFLSIGMGLALPYIILSLFPSLIKKIPRGGNWSLYTERVFGFILLGTVLYFLTLLTPQYVLFTISILWFSAIGLWQFGIFASPVKMAKVRYISYLALLLILLIGFVSSKTLFLQTENKPGSLTGENFTYTALENHISAENIVMVKFTADWCPNCKLVDATAINTIVVVNTVKKQSVVFMTADISTPGTEGEQLLKQLGAQSIPFLAVFSKNSFNSPYCLRDIYSKEDVLTVLKKAIEENKPEETLKPEIEEITF